MASFLSSEIQVGPSVLGNSFYRADLEFHGVGHSGPSFQARIFFNNPEASASSELTQASGYVGSFYVFGHGGCFGQSGHCEVPEQPRQLFDLRPPHQLTPTKMWITVTEPLRRVSEAPGTLIVKVVPVRRRGRSILPAEELLDIKTVSIVTYS